MDLKEILKGSEHFKEEKLSFSEYLELVEKNPLNHLRTSNMYLKDVFEHFEKDKHGHYGLFTLDDADFKPVYGHAKIQDLIYKSLNNFIEEGYNNKFILLVGPNGSAKTSLIKKMMKACELYSLRDQGALYSFSWVFPKGKSGFNTRRVQLGGRDETPLDQKNSYAALGEDSVAAIIESELKDHPLLLLPLKARRSYIKKLLEKDSKKRLDQIKKTYLFNGDVSKKNRQIFESLLKEYNGSYEEVYKHIRVERYTISKRYSVGAVTIEPQMSVDAKMQQITLDTRLRNLPPSIQALNLMLPSGELVMANRGMLEYSDLLKRPLEAYKYLLMTIEEKALNVQGIIMELDILLLGTSNEIHLSAFKKHPDFNSFKERFKIIHVPYLLDYKEEIKIYKDQVAKMDDPGVLGPHCLEAYALWNVMTRLMEPKSDSDHYKGEQFKKDNLPTLVRQINALDKALMYSTGKASSKFSGEDKKRIEQHLNHIKREYFDMEHYEGRYGISPRQSKEILYDLSQKQADLSFVDVLEYLERVVTKEGILEDLAVLKNNSPTYSDNKTRIKLLMEYFENIFDLEIRDCLNLVDDTSYEDYIKKYMMQINALLKKEKVKSELTQRYEDPDLYFIEEFEKNLGQTSSSINNFRSDQLSRLGAYHLENPGKGLEYSKIFSDIYNLLKENFIESQRSELKEISKNLVFYDEKSVSLSQKQKEQIDNLLDNLKSKYSYSKKVALKLIDKYYVK